MDMAMIHLTYFRPILPDESSITWKCPYIDSPWKEDELSTLWLR